MEAISGASSAGISRFSISELQRAVKNQREALDLISSVTPEAKEKIRTYLDMVQQGPGTTVESALKFVSKSDAIVAYIGEISPDSLEEVLQDYKKTNQVGSYNRYADEKTVTMIYDAAEKVLNTPEVQAATGRSATSISGQLDSGKKSAIQALSKLGASARVDVSKTLSRLLKGQDGEEKIDFTRDSEEIINGILSRGIQDISDIMYIVTLIGDAEGSLPPSLIADIQKEIVAFFEQEASQMPNPEELKAFLSMAAEILNILSDSSQGSGMSALFSGNMETESGPMGAQMEALNAVRSSELESKDRDSEQEALQAVLRVENLKQDSLEDDRIADLSRKENEAGVAALIREIKKEAPEARDGTGERAYVNVDILRAVSAAPQSSGDFSGNSDSSSGDSRQTLVGMIKGRAVDLAQEHAGTVASDALNVIQHFLEEALQGNIDKLGKDTGLTI